MQKLETGTYTRYQTPDGATLEVFFVETVGVIHQKSGLGLFQEKPMSVSAYFNRMALHEAVEHLKYLRDNPGIFNFNDKEIKALERVIEECTPPKEAD